MSTAIISTSINYGPKVYEQWAKQGDLIVAGDVNTSPDLMHFINDLGGTYISPKAQEETWPKLSELIGWRNIQRRNIAILEAYIIGYDYIITVDDDNAPTTDDWVEVHTEYVGTAPPTVMKAPWINIGDFVIPPTRQRGLPWGYPLEAPVTIPNFTSAEIAVSQAHIMGAPDCDAVTRIVHEPYTTGVARSRVSIAPGCWCPFNSQATVWDGTYAPLMACLPGRVDRHDDIWASYIAEKILTVHNKIVHVGEPSVRQDRNKHDFISDLQREVYGMERTHKLINELTLKYVGQHWPLPEAYSEIADAIQSVLPDNTYKFMKLWAETWGRHER